MFGYNMIVRTSFIFKKNTALDTRLRNPNEESSFVANTKLTETIMAKLWALFNQKQRPLVRVNPLESGGNKRPYIIKENIRNCQKLK